MRRVAIVGAGITKFYRNAMETPKELAFEATKMELDSCEMKLSDIDCVVHRTAPDAFDGVHMKGEYLSDGSGGFRKPYMRHYVGGGTGVMSPMFMAGFMSPQECLIPVWSWQRRKCLQPILILQVHSSPSSIIPQSNPSTLPSSGSSQLK